MANDPCDPGVSNARALASFEVRFKAAKEQSRLPIPGHATNGDEARYADKCATFTKGLKQDGPGVVNPAAFLSFRKALDSADPQDFAHILTGGTQTLNGPQGAYAFTLAGTDAQQFGSDPSAANQEPAPVVPAPPALASEAYGTELTELYWCSLLRDVAFTDYPGNATAVAAAAELSTMPDLRRASGRRRTGHPAPAVPGQVPRRDRRAVPLAAHAPAHEPGRAGDQPAVDHLPAGH